MIWRIVGKDMLENILSLRFLLSMLLALGLFVAGSVLFLDRHRTQTEDYWKQVNESRSGLRERCDKLYRLAFYRQEVLRKPGALAFCAEGSEKSLPTLFQFTMFTKELAGAGGRSNYILPHFSDIDWAFIVSMIFSFVALVFTYDSICGERETGTLRLMLADAVPRHTVLVGKYLAAMITLGLPLLMGMLASLLVVVSSWEIALHATAWLRIGILMLLALLYLSIFVLLGISVSSRATHSANSMVILLLCWVGLVILVPSLGRVVSDMSLKGPTQMELERNLEEASRQIWNNWEQYGERAGSMSHDLSWPGNNPPARARLRTAATEARNRVLEDHHDRMLAQVFAGRNFTSFSPAVLYQRVCEAVAGTGIHHCVSVYRQIRQYQTDLKQYVHSVDSEDPNSLHLIFDEEGCAMGWQAISHRPVDFDTVPKFQEREPPLGESVRSVIWDISPLGLFNAAFFAAAWISFMRYDVR